MLRIFAVCGLRPGEALALRIDDFEGNQLRIDEALKERQLGEDRIGDTKTDESDSYVPVPPDLSREIAEWIAGHSQHDNPRAFLFLNRRGTGFSVGNYLKKQLKPLAQSVGILDLTQQAFRRTSSTHIQKYGTIRHGQGYAASPQAFGPRDDAEALCQGHSRESAHGGRSTGCANHWNPW